MFIQTENTPNPNSLKFLPGKMVSNQGSFEITRKDETNNELLRNLLSINGIEGIFLGKDFISINKYENSSWDEIKHIVISLINDFYANQLKKLEMNHGFTKGHQELEKINEKIINQRKDLFLYIQNTISALNSEIKIEKGEISYYESLVKKIPISERDLAAIQRKLEVNEKLYEYHKTPNRQ